MDVRARSRVAKAPCIDARMLQLVAALRRRAIASDDRRNSLPVPGPQRHGVRCRCDARRNAQLTVAIAMLGRGTHKTATQQHGSTCADSSARGRLPRRLRHAQRPIHDAVLELLVRYFVFARADGPAHRDPGLVNGFGIARNEWVPPVEIASLGQKAIGAARRQPYDSLYVSRG